MLQSVRLVVQAAGRGRGRGWCRSRSRRSMRRTSSWTTLAGRCANGRGTAYRCRCISVLLSDLEGPTGRAVGAESRRSPHLVVRLVPYVMSRDGCRPLPCAAADSNRLRSALASPKRDPYRVGSQLFGLLPPWCAPHGDSPRSPPVPAGLTGRASSPSSPPAARHRARGDRVRARRPCGGAGRRRPSPSS